MKEIYYNRNNAIEYARDFALSYNPKYYSFSGLGGDCTNFVSQCLFAGIGVMNYLKTFGWYYSSLNDRSPSWTGVEYLYNFLVTNKKEGPYGKISDRNEITVGDIIQLGSPTGIFYHSAIVTKIDNNEIFLASHDRNGFNIPLSSFIYARIRYIHILGGRK